MRSRPLFERTSFAMVFALGLAGAVACDSPGVTSGGGMGGTPPGGGMTPPGGGNPGGGNPGGGNPGGGNPGGGAPPMGMPPNPLPPGGPPGTMPPPTPPGGGGVGEETCSSASAKAEPVPVDLYIMQDKSGSMMMPAQPTSPMTKWEAVKRALTAFVQSPSTAGMNVGLGLFPADNTSPACQNCRDILCLLMCQGASCMTTDYARPTIMIEPLPAASMRIVTALDRVMLSGGTPTRPALEGAIQYARMHEMTTRRRVAIALATDGEPTGCDAAGPTANTIPSISTLARTAAMGGINTFVIGVGPALMNLNAIAMAGGTTQAYLVESGNVDALIAALKAIQTQASKLACSFAIPPPPMGQMLDPNKVNVTFAPMGTPANAGTRIPRVANRAACGAMGGWYYDNPMAPTQVNLCDASCQMVNMSPNGELGLQFGCKTTVIE